MNTESQVLNVPIEDIIPNRFQPRLNFDESALSELAASIKEHGIIQPLVLRRLGDKYEIVAGERRYKASKMAGLTSVPAIISTLDDKKSAEVAIVENIQRKDLTSIEEAKSYKALLDKCYLTQEELAKKMGLSQSAISNKLRLLSLSANVQDALMQNKISERHARSLLQLQSFQEQDEWLNKIINDRLTVRELDRKLKELAKPVEEKIQETPIVEENTTVNNIQNEINTTSVEKPVNIVEEAKEENEGSGTNMNLFGAVFDNNNNNTSNNDNSSLNTNLTNSTPIFNAESKPMPNKFFNFLEDEQANMSTEEEEEIELLDFLVPDTNQVKEKDLTKANNLVDNLIQELQSSTYNVRLEKDENTEEIKYIITVNKKEES